MNRNSNRSGNEKRKEPVDAFDGNAGKLGCLFVESNVKKCVSLAQQKPDGGERE